MPKGGTYEEVLAKLMREGYQPGVDPVPEALIDSDPNAEVVGSNQGYLAGPEGSFDNPMELSTMMVQGDVQSETAPGGAKPGFLAGGEMEPPPSSGVFAGLSDEEAQKYAAMGDLKHQRDRAQAMRDTDDAKGRYVNQGRTFVAASPLEHLVVGAKRWKGKKDEKKVGGKQTEGRRGIIDLLRNKKDLTDEDLQDILG